MSIVDLSTLIHIRELKILKESYENSRGGRKNQLKIKSAKPFS